MGIILPWPECVNGDRKLCSYGIIITGSYGVPFVSLNSYQSSIIVNDILYAKSIYFDCVIL